MASWNKKVKAILFSWYLGQNGNIALAEVLSGKTNPSGRLPITIEKKFTDSPAYPYVPEGEKLYKGWSGDFYKKGKMIDINYKEGILVGYRWYEKKQIEPLYPFGFGLSYSHFSYADLKISKPEFKGDDSVTVTLSVVNDGLRSGFEVVQLYVQTMSSATVHPVKELKGFVKIFLNVNETRLVMFKLRKKDFAYWDASIHNWNIENGQYKLLVGSASNDIKLSVDLLIDK